MKGKDGKYLFSINPVQSSWGGQHNISISISLDSTSLSFLIRYTGYMASGISYICNTYMDSKIQTAELDEHIVRTKESSPVALFFLDYGKGLGKEAR